MAKEEWGVKRLCPTTGKRFYDLNKDPVISPYTGEVVEVETGKRSMIAADAEDGASRKSAKPTSSEETAVVDDEDDVVDVDLGDDDVLDDDEDDDNVSLDEIADVSNEDDD